ncbi:MAG TPA: hypothetical protein VHF47_09885 [Acidimicrobiales bacterium]|nr:hypothetical protein [Acidimicrobiales bacterium]
MVTGYASALVVTLVVEAAVYGVGLPRLGPVSRRTAVVAGLVVNLVSHPVAWFALWPALRAVVGRGPAFVAVEALVCLGEWAALARWRPFDRPLLAVMVLIANAASIVGGAVIA